MENVTNTILNIWKKLTQINNKMNIILSEISKEQKNSILQFMYFTEFKNDFNITFTKEIETLTKKKLNFLLFTDGEKTYIKYFDDKNKLMGLEIVDGVIKEKQLIREYNKILKEIGEQIGQEVKQVNNFKDFFIQLQNTISQYLKENKEEIEQINELTEKEFELPIVRGTQWLELLKLFNGLKVNLELLKVTKLKDVLQNKEKNTQIFNNINQIIIKSQEQFGNTETILFVKGRNNFNIQKLDTDESLSEDFISVTLQIQNFSKVNFQFIITNFEDIFNYFQEIITTNKDIPIPETIIEIFKEDIYKDLQLNIIKDTIKKSNKIEIPIRIVGNKSSITDKLSGGYIINFVIEGGNLDTIQNQIYGIINKYYIGNIEISSNLKEMSQDLVSSLQNQGGIIGQLTNSIIDQWNEIKGIQNIFVKSQSQLKNLQKLVNQQSDKKYVTTYSQEQEPLKQLKQQQQTSSQNDENSNTDNTTPEDEENNELSDKDKETIQIFSPSTQPNYQSKKVNSEDMDSLFEKIKKDIPFNKILFDD